MKIGAVYNFWDCEELLEQSIISIRKNVDYIAVVYSTISNYGIKRDFDYNKFLIGLQNKGLINSYFCYKSELSLFPAQNEMNKRQIGYDLCRVNGLEYFLSMDCDEFYDEEQFEDAKEWIGRYNISSSACGLYTYYKEPIYRINPPEKYYVPFLEKISYKRSYILDGDYYCHVDPTRRLKLLPPLKEYIFKPEQLIMHHYSFVRKDIRMKFENSSARDNFYPKIDRYVRYFERWQFGDVAIMPGIEDYYSNVIKVENKFKI